MKPDPPFTERPCARCGCPARLHVSYCFSCDECACQSFDPGPIRRDWLRPVLWPPAEIDIPEELGWHV